jgi:hypothetical protein
MLVLGSAASAVAGKNNDNNWNYDDDYKNSGQYNSNQNSETLL